MSIFTAFVIGLLVGWIIEWIIDWAYWRRKRPAAQPEALEKCRGQVATLEQEIASYKSQLAALQAGVSRSAQVSAAQEIERPAEVKTRSMEPVAATDRKADNLEIINGIGPVIARTLNNAGIFTFAELGNLTVEDLRAILGKQIQRLADEEQILAQARQLAEKHNGGG